MRERWERADRTALTALAALLLALSLPGIGPMEAARLLPDGVWPLLFPLERLLRLALAALAAGVAPDRIRRSICTFAPVEHRLEPVREAGGVLWINDSKATNVDSVWYALESMKRPTVWIAGGTDKGNDYEPLKAFAREKVHTLVCMGLDNRKLIDSFTGVVPEVISTSSLDDAMAAARDAARPGDAVLLSPACASFDLFRNYEQRGELFKRWVNERL